MRHIRLSVFNTVKDLFFPNPRCKLVKWKNQANKNQTERSLHRFRSTICVVRRKTEPNLTRRPKNDQTGPKGPPERDRGLEKSRHGSFSPTGTQERYNRTGVVSASESTLHVTLHHFVRETQDKTLRREYQGPRPTGDEIHRVRSPEEERRVRCT